MLIVGVVLVISGWQVYKYFIGQHAVEDAQLYKDYSAQKDSTKAWKDAYTGVELARKNLHDTLNVLDGLLKVSHAEASRWHDTAAAAKGRLLTAGRPAVGDSTSPEWMHRSVQLEQIVAAQDKELAGKDVEISVLTSKQKLLLSQLSKDSVALHSANANIIRLDSLVTKFKDKSECRVAWVLPCMSRTQAFVTGLGIGIGGTVLANTYFKKP